MKPMKQGITKIILFSSFHHLQRSQLHVIMKTEPSYILQQLFNTLDILKKDPPIISHWDVRSIQILKYTCRKYNQ